jgi:Fe-S-cluster containining protein
VNEKRFQCTACGKCCYGLLPLTLKDALAHAGRFPLALIWKPIRPGSKAFDLATQIGATVRLPDRKTVAVQIVPTGYIPSSFRCPALRPDNLCGIHDDKPSRCRTMPFYPYREEQDQAEMLIPRAGWACDTSAAAPVVYRDKQIVPREDFDRERQDLLDQARMLQACAASVLPGSPVLMAALAKAAAKPLNGRVVTGFSALLPRLPKHDVIAVAQKQLPVLRDFAARTAADAALADYHRHYREWAAEMEKIAARAGDVRPSS